MLEAKIREYLQNKAEGKSREELKQDLHITSGEVLHYERKFRQALLECLHKEVYQPSRIARKMGVPRDSLVSLLPQLNFKRNLRNYQREAEIGMRLQQHLTVNGTLANRESSLEQSQIKSIAYKFGIPLRTRKCTPATLQALRTADGSESLRCISSELGITVAYASLIMQENAILDEWKQKRGEWKKGTATKPIITQKLTSLLRHYFLARATIESWPSQKTAEYLVMHPKTTFSYSMLHELFSQREIAEKSGKLYSLKKFEELTGIERSLVRIIFQRVGKRSMNTNFKKVVTPQKLKEAMARGAHGPFSVMDISYFLRMQRYNVYNFYNDHSLTAKVDKDIAHPVPNFRVVSQIYEAQDCGYDTKSTNELLNIPLPTIENIITRRATFEPILVKGLQQLFKNKNLSLPYINQSQLDDLLSQKSS